MPRIFISYFSNDVEIAEEIENQLQISGYGAWHDKRSIETDWSKEVAYALSKLDIVLLVWTENASESKYVKNEWMTARALGKLIKPIVFTKEPSSSIDLPEPLRNLQAIVDLETLHDIKKNIKKLIVVFPYIGDIIANYM